MRKKILCLILLLAINLISRPSFASESIISSLIINDTEEKEIEIVMDKDKMYLPCKCILSYFEIPFKENHVDKSLLFKNAVVKDNALYIDGVKQSYHAFFVKNGITGVQNEFFLPAEALSKITGKNITSDPTQLLAFYKADDAEIVKEKKDENPFLIKDKTYKAKAYEELTMPVQKGFISLDSVGFGNNMMSDSYSQIYRSTQTKNAMMINNTKVTLQGKLNSGDYKLDLGTNSYESNMFAFSGISPQYKNRYDKYDYIVGKIDQWDFGQGSIGSEIMGVQLKDHVDKKTNYKDIQGTVDPTSTIKVYINDDYEKELSTYGGFYSLKDVFYNGKIKTIKIEELLADGTRKEVFSKEYKDDENAKYIPKKDILLGISGLQNRLWANNGYIYQSTTKKAVAGAKFYNKINDKLTFENFVIADKIVAGSSNNMWNMSVLGNKKYLNFGTMRNPNALQGESYMGLLSYKNNEKIDSQLYFGASNATTIDTITPGGLGAYLDYDTTYRFNKENLLRGSLFASSPNFYMAGSTSGCGSFTQDRVGARISGNTKIKNTTIAGSYSKYESNFGNYYEGGLLAFDEYNLIARTNFKKLPTLTLKVNNKNGANQIGGINSSSYEISGNKRLKCLNLSGGIRSNNYSNQYSAEGYSSFTSKYSDTFFDVNFPLGKKFGYLTLGHEDIVAESDSRPNGYKTVKINYSTPTFKNISMNFMTGFHYAGQTQGNDIGFGIMKRLASGSVMSLNYRFSQAPCMIIENMYLPSNIRHSITLDFSELYGLGDRGLEAIGTGNVNKGYVQVTTFLDVNQNGIKDKDEPNIDNIPIKIDNDSEVLITQKDGSTKLKPEDSGFYNIQIFEDQLPTFLACHNKTKPSRYIKVNDNKKTKVEFGLISSVGIVNGSVTIKDEYNNRIIKNDIVVSVLDDLGNEITYTNLNEDGTFSISGLHPGKYIIEVDKNLQVAYHLVPETNSEKVTIEIPPEYKDYVNINNVNLNYKYQI